MATRVYELAKEFGISSKEIMQCLHQCGVDVTTHMALVSPEAVTMLRKRLAGASQAHVPSKGTATTPPKIEPVQSNVATSNEKTHSAEDGIIAAPMTVGAFAEQTHLLLSDVILSLLRHGVAASKNQVIAVEHVLWLAQKYAIKVRQQEQSNATTSERRTHTIAAGVAGVKRQPIVVVMGHVDHGKTTLLDTIRKTHVASREKGGITQHLGAYEACTTHGNITFLDTPGHEAFSMIRNRGAKGADIAIVVIAADDGIKPQTIEALKIVQRAEIPLIIAINKVDKASPAQIETVKRQLTQYGVVPEEWGGQTICMGISARSGEGVDALLEVIILQADVMELQADLAMPAIGYILESHAEKGLGSVGTIITRHGILRVGDYFVAGATEGKVTAIVDARGKRLQEVYPAVPVKIAGFRDMPHVGDDITVVADVSLGRQDRLLVSQQQVHDKATNKGNIVGGGATEKQIRLVVKADAASSLEAIMGSLASIGEKIKRHVMVIHEGVGAITENDVIRAADAKAYLYGLHVKVEPKAREIARQRHIDIYLYDIIYRLLESIEGLVVRDRVVEKVLKKVGEAIVLKVFDIKKMGVIAGAQVKSGILTRDGVVKVFRGKSLVGEGAIKSLQRDRKSVKEVHTGYECAFLIDNFEEWEEGDRVECYMQTIVAQ